MLHFCILLLKDDKNFTIHNYYLFQLFFNVIMKKGENIFFMRKTKKLLLIIFNIHLFIFIFTNYSAAVHDRGCFYPENSSKPDHACAEGLHKFEDTGCPETMVEETWHRCEWKESRKQITFFCCREKNIEDFCNEKAESGSDLTKGVITTSDVCEKFNGEEILNSGDKVCCDYHFKGAGGYPGFKDKCYALTSEKFLTYPSQVSCEDDEEEIIYIYYPAGQSGIGVRCCAKSLTNTSLEKICKDESSFFNNVLKVYFATYDSLSKKLVCDPGDKLFWPSGEDLENATEGCCLQTSELDDPEDSDDSGPITINLNVNKLKFQSLLDMNPLKNSSVFSDPDKRTPGNIINQALTAVVFPIAGVGLLILILIGGFQVLSGSLGGKQNSIDLGKKRVTAAIIGFTLLFLVYWIWRLIALATGLAVT
jgi:hypothetical protein